MSTLGWVLIVLAAPAAVSLALQAVRTVRRPPRIGTISNLTDDTVMDGRGAVLSIQAGDLVLPEEALEAIWTPMHLERIARTYWRFLSRATLGLIRVSYTEGERFVVLLARPFVLLRFQAPEYEMDAQRGIVRWRIERGVLVSPRGRGGSGWLQIDVRRRPGEVPGRAVAHVEVEVRNFYPAIATAFTRFVYTHTQSRIHVLVTYAFLRSLSRLDLAESRVGRFSERLEDVPDPPPPDAPARPADRSLTDPGAV